MATEPLAAQTYQLLIEVAEPLRLVVGRLGICEFPPGCYVYTGSAKRNMAARVRRHLARAKRLHWHVDYLLAAEGVRVREVRYFEEPECAVNQCVAGTVVVAGFGATDCRAGCGSHLKRVAEPY